ncbi:hypothetical protein Focb16_v008196 [Fusarium oxysporum f. sp. cubense]|uniref:SnoaL-like domain-containing protein n=1 Tax=Fusarium oxysporum f. sp. cubense TaxID=61366 RepID=A0A559LUU7_FUSOC|nr:hypothetical protein Focb16_v008196 [Fusarium oxysporum f. sp. cubense]
MNYDDYIASYNSPDENAKAVFFTEDVIVESPVAKFHSRQELLDSLAAAHKFAKEELRPINVVRQGDFIMAELDAAFSAFEDDPNNFFHPFKKGECRAWRFFAVYKLRNDKISELRLAFWPGGWEIPAF